MWRSTLFFACAIAFVACDEDTRESRVVHIAQGPVRGYKDPVTNIYSFYSIPYASVPTGRNRFKAPLPPPTWRYPFEAVNKHISCPQASTAFLGIPEHKQQEDCLIANVFVPETARKDLPVLVSIHGGAFQAGASHWMLLSKLQAENDFIVVSINYRLGTHGFLCLGTEDVPGNAGMKDQVAGLRWVKKNIASFGGNPDDVTIQGGSAGSAAVDLLMLSKSAEGLFNKVIPESGASIALWTIQSDPLENAKKFAIKLNFTDVDDIYALEEFYKTASFELLTSVPFFNNPDSTFGPSPCVERATEEEIFLEKSPVDILKSGDYRKVPLLYGFANMEGLIRIAIFDSWKHKMNERFSDFLPADLKFKSDKQKEEVAKQVKEFYFRDEQIGNTNVLDYVDFFTDVMFAYPMLRTVKYHVENSHDQIYLYEYSFVDDNTTPVPYTEVKGANHCAQTVAVFDEMPIPNLNITYTEDFLKISSSLRKMWRNFIKTGEPIPEGSPLPPWPAVERNWSPHMSLGNEIALRGSLLERRMRFWDDIYSKHYRNPIPPPKPTRSHLDL